MGNICDRVIQEIERQMQMRKKSKSKTEKYKFGNKGVVQNTNNTKD